MLPRRRRPTRRCPAMKSCAGGSIGPSTLAVPIGTSTADQNAAWQVVHGLLAFGKDFEIYRDGKLIPAPRLSARRRRAERLEAAQGRSRRPADPGAGLENRHGPSRPVARLFIAMRFGLEGAADCRRPAVPRRRFVDPIRMGHLSRHGSDLDADGLCHLSADGCRVDCPRRLGVDDRSDCRHGGRSKDRSNRPAAALTGCTRCPGAESTFGGRGRGERSSGQRPTGRFKRRSPRPRPISSPTAAFPASFSRGRHIPTTSTSGWARRGTHSSF